MVYNISSPFKTKSFKWFFVSVKKQIKPLYCFCKNKVWNIKVPFWSSSLSIPSSPHTFKKLIVHWYNRVHIPAHLRFGSKHFSRGYCVLERICVRASIREKADSSRWCGGLETAHMKQQECSSLGFYFHHAVNWGPALRDKRKTLLVF